MLLFSNNARTTLAAVLTGDDSDPDYETILAAGDGSADLFQEPEDGDAELATLFDATDESVWEVVQITTRTGATFTVQRGVELSPGLSVPPSWPIGTFMEGRVTALMLGGFQQTSDQNAEVRYERRGSAGLVRPSSNLGGAEVFALNGYPALPDFRSRANTFGVPPTLQDPVFAPEVVGGTFPIDLGSAAAWAAGTTYKHLAVVVPSTPDGYQYWLALNAGVDSSTTDVAPTFAGPGTTEARNGYSPDDVVVGYWIPTDLTRDITLQLATDAKFVLTEVGFMARDVTAGTPPYVSIGTDIDATKFVNNQQLTQITDNGHVHRFPISSGGDMVEYLRFVVDSAAAGGRFRGRFYFRGFFLNDSE
jgi:hypothetical protein